MRAISVLGWMTMLGLGFVACVQDAPEPSAPPSTESPASSDDAIVLPPNLEVAARPELRAAANCHEVEQYIEDTAVLEMRAELIAHREASLKYGYCCDGAVDAGMATPGGATGAAPTSYTGTNNQVAGVEEGDVVKTDGTSMFAVGDGKVQLLSSWPATQLRLAATARVDGEARELLLDEQSSRLVVFSTEYPSTPNPYFMTWVTVLDVSNLSSPRVLQRYAFPGGYLTSRRIGSSVRFVLRGELRRPALQTWLMTTDGSAEDIARKYAELAQSNEQLIRSRSLAQWLPAMTAQFSADAPVQAVPVNCTSILIPNGPTHLGLFTAGTVDLAVANPPQVTAVLTRADTVYASAEALYVTHEHWRWNVPSVPESDHSYVHKFDLTDPFTVTWAASGVFSGKVLDQFSLDEHAGYLRVATTTTTSGGAVAAFWTNHVRVLQHVGPLLKVVGETEPLAPGERIYSARFVGDKAFVVTFRRVDPLFTFDLSDPTAPTKVGELKIPGFSTYMQLIDSAHILAVGEDNGAVKVSLFDVGDLSAPKEKASLVLGTWAGDSAAVHDHRAFTWAPQSKRLAIPFVAVDYWSNSDGGYCPVTENDVRVFEVDPLVGITPLGDLAMEDLVSSACTPSVDYYQLTRLMQRHQPRRSIIADNFVYAVSDAAVRVADVHELGRPRATVLFP